MNKRLMIAAAVMAAVNVQAQKSPVGIVSFQDTVKSVQFGAISSVAADGGRGLQLSSVSNASPHTFNGLQLSSVSNITNGMDRGLQLSGLLNVSSAMMGGWQWGAVNYTDSLNGLQIGAFNVARKRPKGWQIGIVNLSYDSLGHKIGLVNVNPKTDIDLMLAGHTHAMQMMVTLFGPSNYFAWDILQLICILITIFLLYRITWELFGDKTICGIVGLLST